MSIKVGEIGKDLYVGTSFDMNAAPFTSLALNFISPDGTVTFTRTSAANNITAPNVTSPALPNVGNLPANTYMLYKTQAVDFAVDGNWTVSTQYEDATSLFYGDTTILVIEPNGQA
tara:strand:+ start:145 stop:492 length:348 start_codon:yes stop_codon:yes gene_type:complete